MPTDEFVRALAHERYRRLQHRNCTAETPMQPTEKDAYRWHHGDAKKVQPFFNLVVCECPHCGMSFSCLPRENSNGT